MAMGQSERKMELTEDRKLVGSSNLHAILAVDLAGSPSLEVLQP